MRLVMYTLETVPQTGLWQTISKGKGCCVSPVTVILHMSVWCLTCSYAYQAFIVPHSASRMLNSKGGIHCLVRKMVTEKIKVISIPGKIYLYSQPKKRVLPRQTLSISSACSWDLDGDYEQCFPWDNSYCFKLYPMMLIFKFQVARVAMLGPVTCFPVLSHNHMQDALLRALIRKRNTPFMNAVWGGVYFFPL